MRDDEQKAYDSLLSKLSRWEKRGKVVLPAGTKLIAHAPDVAPRAYLHALFPPLSENGIGMLQDEIGGELPDGLLRFYRRHNGCHFFMQISVPGLRYSYDRADLVTMLEQPHALRTFLLGRDAFFEKVGESPFAKIGSHDEPNYRIASINNSGKVTVWDERRRKAETTHQNVFIFLTEQFSILENYYNQ